MVQLSDIFKMFDSERERERQRESLQYLQEGATNYVKVVHLAVQKIITLLVIQKSQGVSNQGKLKKRKNLPNYRQRYEKIVFVFAVSSALE